MTMHTPPANQGQIVEVSYGWNNGSLYRRDYDRSDRSEAWYVADEESANELPEGWEAINDEPSIAEWTACEEPSEDED